MRVERIDDLHDPRLDDYRDIRERDLVGRRGYFIAEGQIVIETLLRSSQCRLQSLLIAERKIDTTLSLVGADFAAPIFAARDQLIAQIAGFSVHRGMLGLGTRISPKGPSGLLACFPHDALIMVLVGIANHDNMGGLFRNAAAFGVDAVLLDATCCDPLYRKAIRVSAGSVLTLPFARFTRDEDLVAFLQDSHFDVFALSPSGQRPLSAVPQRARQAIIFGAEGPGLPSEILDRTHTVSIPMGAAVDSLNVATASGIVLHYLRCLARR